MNTQQRNIFSSKFLLGVLMITGISCGFVGPTYAKGIKKHKASNKVRMVVKQNKKISLSNLKLEKATFTSLVTPFASIYERSEVKNFTQKYNKATLIKTTNDCPHVNYIVEQVKKRKLPNEIAMLPMLESNFKLNAVSNKGAAGLWQFMPATGKQFGLKQEGDIDQRKDVVASTEAALTYLEYLHKKFNKDWPLALAAYNAGEGTVDRAIKRNKKAGKPTNFWALKLPKETKNYVPQFFAINKLVKEAKPK